ncbi:MAG: MlaD family protein [Campylobacterales bacterium]
MKLEAKIGLFVFSGLVLLFLLSTQVSSFVRMGKSGYIVHASISNALGIDKDTKVKINGIEVGYVKELTLKDRKILMTLFIYDGVTIPEDSAIMLSQDNLFGGNFVNILLGQSEAVVMPEGYILNEKRSYSMQELMGTVNEMAEEIRSFVADVHARFNDKLGSELELALSDFRSMAQRLGDAGGNVAILAGKLNGAADALSEHLPETMANAREVSGQLKVTLSTVNARLPAIMAQIDDLTRDLNGSAGSLREHLPTILAKFEKLEDNLTLLAEDARRELNITSKNLNATLADAKPTLVKVGDFFDEGKQAVKKVNKYLDKMTQSELELALRTGYQAKDGGTFTQVSATYLPNPTRYYMLDVVSRDDYSKFAAPGVPKIPDKHDKSTTLISAQMGKRYDNLLIRGGLIESTGGAGVDYFAMHDKLRVKADIFDFNARNDVRTTKPHTRVTADYKMLKHLHLFGGYDHFLDKKTANLFVGAGVSFIDDDLKYLLGSSAGSLVK